jgi:hypothetical protein
MRLSQSSVRRVLHCLGRRHARWLLALALAPLAAALACAPSNEVPASYVGGLRVVGVKAEPPEVPAGASSTLTIWYTDPSGATPTVTWSRCMRAPVPGDEVNPDCVSTDTAPYLEPLAAGPTTTTVMPDPATTSGVFGEMDATGGVYLPLVAHVSTAADSVTTTYRLRLHPAGDTEPPNQNPKLTAVLAGDTSGSAATTPLDEATPLVVHAGDTINLAATFDPTSAEAYTAPRFTGGASTAVVTEQLTTSWFVTGGKLDFDKTNSAQPQNVLHMSERLPAPGSRIDLYLVAHDERGGADMAHRVLQFQ